VTLQAKRRLVGWIHSSTRVVIGTLFACHGASNLFGLFVFKHAASLPFGAWPGWWAAMIELVGGLLVAIGLYTRPAAVLCSGAMAFAYFTVHQQHGMLPIQNGGEPAAMFCWVFLLVAALGAGPISVDTWRARRSVRIGSDAPAAAYAGVVVGR
jgi:putative oxidoreductase